MRDGGKEKVTAESNADHETLFWGCERCGATGYVRYPTGTGQQSVLYYARQRHNESHPKCAALGTPPITPISYYDTLV